MDVSGVDFLSAISLNKLINCKYFTDLKVNHKSGEVINDSFRIVAPRGSIEDFSCGVDPELPEMISHHLHLNLSFVTKDYFKDGNYTSPLVNNDADYITGDISMIDLLSTHNLIVASNYIREIYHINFLLRKQPIGISLKNYFRIFNVLIWMLLFATIIVIGVIQGIKLISRKKNNSKSIFKSTLNLIFNYFNLMMSNQSSVLLNKIVPRNYLMYIIPLLSIIVINLMKESIYSNMISPPKQWCETLECFAQSNIRFITTNSALKYRFSEIEKDHQFKLIASRIILHKVNSEFKKIIIYLNCNSHLIICFS